MIAAYLDAMRRYAGGGSGGGAPPPETTLYLKENGDSTTLSENDVAQGAYGDCFLLASLDEVARVAPQDIVGDIKSAGAGRETVTFHGGQQGWESWAPFQAGDYRTTVANDFPAGSVNANVNDHHNTQGGVTEIWPQVMEAAYAQTHGGYEGFANGGQACQALEAITGKPFTYTPADEVTARDLVAMARQPGEALVFDTKGGTIGDGLVGGHSYAFDGLTHDRGKLVINLTNPWGNGQHAAVPFRDLAANFTGVDHGQA